VPQPTPETRTLRLRLIAEVPPPDEHQERWTEFGLQDKKGHIHPGQEQPDGSLQFDFEVQARLNPLTGSPRFSGPYVQGPPLEPFVYLSWKYAEGPPEWIRRQKIPLRPITWERIQEAAQHGPATFQATVPPITIRTATVPTEWTISSTPAK
jgi:hypothetical protein